MSQIGYPNFELVVYSVETPTTFFPIVDGLDPGGQYINYRLFRDATRFVNGHPTKDISALNRDPKRVSLTVFVIRGRHFRARVEAQFHDIVSRLSREFIFVKLTLRSQKECWIFGRLDRKWTSIIIW
jgi:hypothetical protein